MNEEFHFRSHMGINITNPVAMPRVEFVFPEYLPPTQAEIRFDKIVMRIKTRISWLRKIAVGIIILSGITLSLVVIVFLATLATSEFNGMLIGILGAELILTSIFLPPAIIETSKYDISFKHKGRRY